MKEIIRLLATVLVVITLTGCEDYVSLDHVREFCDRNGYVLLGDDYSTYDKAAEELENRHYIVYSPEEWDSGEALSDMISRTREMGYYVFEYDEKGKHEMCIILNDCGYLVFEDEEELFEEYRVTEDDMKEYFAARDYILYQRGTHEWPLVEYLCDNGWIVYRDEDELRRAIDDGEILNESEPLSVSVSEIDDEMLVETPPIEIEETTYEEVPIGRKSQQPETIPVVDTSPVAEEQPESDNVYAVVPIIPVVEESQVEQPKQEQVNNNMSSVYDYVGNKNTKKFHYAWCSSVDNMKDINKYYYTGVRDEMLAMGYEPCKNCNP